MSNTTIPVMGNKVFHNSYMRFQSVFLDVNPEKRAKEKSVEFAEKVNEQLVYFQLGATHYLQKNWDEIIEENGEHVLKHMACESSYNEETDELIENIEYEGNEELFRDFSQAVIQFATAALKKNKYAYEAFMSSKIQTDRFSYYNKNVAKNVYILFVSNPNLLEQMIKSNPAMLLKALEGEENLEGKLKDVYQIPKSAMAIINKLKLTPLLPEFNQLSAAVDGNEMVIFMEFLQNTKKMQGSTPNARQQSVRHFLRQFTPCILEAKLPLKTTLEYIIRQTYQHHDFKWSHIVNVAGNLVDYERMRAQQDYGERWPQNIVKAHNTVKANLQSCSEEIKAMFTKAVADYKFLEHEITINNGKPNEMTYVAIVPDTPDDLLKEGDALNHCVGSYGRLVAIGQSKVLFLRKKSDRDTSLVTFEIDKNRKVVHAKGINNTDPEAEEAKALKAWEIWAASVV